MIHPTVHFFEERTRLLDLQGSVLSLHDAMANLAAWIGLAAHHLSEDDMAVLGEIGEALYREGLRQRQGGGQAKKVTCGCRW